MVGNGDKFHFSEWAKQYWEAGYNPFPLIDRVPVVKEWQVWGESRMTKDELDNMIKRWSSWDKINGIGVCLTNELASIDVDISNPEYVKRFKDLLPEGAPRRFGSKGFAALVRHNGLSSRKINSGPNKEPFEILSKGCFLVMPPSYHPKTQRNYLWLGSQEITPISTLPLINDCLVSSLIDVGREYRQEHAACNPSGPLAQEGMTLISGSNDAEGRHNKLIRAVWAISQKPGITRPAMVQEIIEYDRLYNQPNPWFTDETETAHRNKKTPQDRAAYMVKNALKKLDKSESIVLEPHYPSPNPVNDTDHTVDDFSEASAGQLITDEFKENFSIIRAQSLKVNERFMEGAFEQFYNLCRTKNTAVLPISYMGGALTLMSMAAANVIEFADTRGSMFIVNLINTSAGKSVPQDCIKKVTGYIPKLNEMRIAPVPIQSFMGQASYRSFISVRDGCSRNQKHARFDIHDEVGKLFDSKQGNSNQARTIQEVLGMFSAVNTSVQAESVADKAKSLEAISNPYIVLFGSSTPADVRPHMNEEMIAKGLAGRFLFCVDHVSTEEYLEYLARDDSKTYGERDEDIIEDEADFVDGIDDEFDMSHPVLSAHKGEPVHESIENLAIFLNYWLSRPAASQIMQGTMMNLDGEIGEIRPHRLKYTRSVHKLMKEINSDAFARADAMEKQGNVTGAMFRRKLELVRKMAIARWMGTEGYKEAMSKGKYKAPLVLKLEHLVWANELWEELWINFEQFMDMTKASSTSHAGILQRAKDDTLSYIYEGGKAGRYRSHVVKFWGRRVSKYDSADLIKDPDSAFEVALKQWTLNGKISFLDGTRRGGSITHSSYCTTFSDKN